MMLNDSQLSILHDASTEPPFKPTTRFEEQEMAKLVVAGYMDASGNITQLGRGALKGQGGR